MQQLLHLPRFIPTFAAILLRPISFFKNYHELVTTRETSFWDLNAERDDDPYLSPVKFSALAILLSNLIFPLIMLFGVQVGAVSPEFARFADWAEQQGHLDPYTITDIKLIDDFLRELIVLLIFYTLGHLIHWFSGKKIPARFAAGYFFYWNAWSLLGSLVTLCLVIFSIIIPLYETGLPTLFDIVIYLASTFMFLLFPVFFWPRFIEVSRRSVALAMFGGFAVWIGIIALIAPMIVQIPDFSQPAAY